MSKTFRGICNFCNWNRHQELNYQSKNTPAWFELESHHPEIIFQIQRQPKLDKATENDFNTMLKSSRKKIVLLDFVLQSSTWSEFEPQHLEILSRIDYFQFTSENRNRSTKGYQSIHQTNYEEISGKIRR